MKTIPEIVDDALCFFVGHSWKLCEGRQEAAQRVPGDLIEYKGKMYWPAELCRMLADAEEEARTTKLGMGQAMTDLWTGNGPLSGKRWRTGF